MRVIAGASDGHTVACPDRKSLLHFFLVAHAIWWVIWAPLAVRGLGWNTSEWSPYLHLAGGLGPLLAAALVSLAQEGRVGLVRLLRGLTLAHNRGWWVLVGVATPVLLFASSVVAMSAFGYELAWQDIGKSTEFPELGKPLYWLVTILCYGLGEEVGWRGFALPRLQAEISPMAASLWLGATWAFWHLPLFTFTEGLGAMGMGEIAGWLFSLVTGSMLMTWLHNRSRGSVLAVAAFHGVLDILMGSPVKGPLMSTMGALIGVAGCAAGVALVRSHAKLSRN